MLEDILLRVNKPARYIGNELNSAKKGFNDAYVKFALCFPELYEVGMSNYGLRILYATINNIPDTVCERVFHPAADMEAIMRNKSLKIFSLESRRQLTDFDIIGFSLSFELNYTNLLNILDLAGIPLQSSMRTGDFPLIIAGGSCAFNPEPLAEFIDLFVVGEAEEAIVEIVQAYAAKKRKAKDTRPHKKDILYALSRIEGAYAPSLYDVEYYSDATIKSFTPKSSEIPKKIKKRTIKDINKISYPQNWLVPYIQIIHDRITLEVARGCPNRCRFCQARSIYFPYRCCEPAQIVGLAKQAYALTGYEDISLLGLCVSDHYKIREILAQLINAFEKEAVGISVPSIKVKEDTKEMLALITKVKKSGLTVALETGSCRLRKVINKHYDLDVFFNTVEHAYRLGYRHLKLYFMIGLPGETEEDLDDIGDLSVKVSQLRTDIDRKAGKVNLSVATFIPKPHTPFQWLGMQEVESIERKQAYLDLRIKKRVRADTTQRRNIYGSAEKKANIKINFHNRLMSFVEGVLSRADRRVSKSILGAWRLGARFDAWDNYFLFDIWQKSFKQSGVNPHFYLTRKRRASELLPWDFIDTGIPKEELLADFKRADI